MEELDCGQRLAGHNVASLDAELIEFYCVEGTQLYGYFAHATFFGCELVHHFTVNKMRKFSEANGQILEEHMLRRWHGA
jgi:ribosome-binding ATPase YchF (GTP1/OBG family)